MSRQDNLLTKPQVALYWRAFAAACRNLELSTSSEREEYRHSAMQEEAGVDSIKKLTRTKDFDAIMRRFLLDAGDYEGAFKFSIGEENRMAAMIGACIAQLMEISHSEPDAWGAYLGGLLRKAQIPFREEPGRFWMDVSRASARSVFIMLDTHRKRLIDRYCVAHDAHLAKAFDIRRIYSFDGDSLAERTAPRARVPSGICINLQ